MSINQIIIYNPYFFLKKNDKAVKINQLISNINQETVRLC